MARKLIILFLGLGILLLGLVYGSPVEITFQPGHRIGVLVLTLLIAWLFYRLFSAAIKLKPDALKIVGMGLTGLLLLPYLWISLWAVPQAIYSDGYPIPTDIAEYTAPGRGRIVGQFMAISGSLHHYQNRKIIHDFGNGIRISYLYPDRNINGTWTVHRKEWELFGQVVNDTTYTATFAKGREIE